jgi:hypothetical protein
VVDEEIAISVQRFVAIVIPRKARDFRKTDVKIISTPREQF